MNYFPVEVLPEKLEQPQFFGIGPCNSNRQSGFRTNFFLASSIMQHFLNWDHVGITTMIYSFFMPTVTTYNR
eukprot:5903768-Ditylum_brightwellii.AAC.1